MNPRVNSRAVVSCALAFALALPGSVFSHPGPQSAERAGEVQQVIPDVKIERGQAGSGRQFAAEARTPVHWLDNILTAVRARARIRLDDGSALNVGSNSSLRIVQHDAAAQRTQLELQYGRIRSQVVKLAQPGAEFRVNTPVGTAGVIGTDFFLAFEDGLLTLIVFEGIVRLCNLAGQCVDVPKGMKSAIRRPDTGGAAAAASTPPAPDPPSPVSPAESMNATETTQVEPSQIPSHGKGPGWWAGVFGFVALGVAAIVLATRPESSGQRTGQQPLP